MENSIILNKDGTWEKVIDFTKLEKDGVNINELLAAL